MPSCILQPRATSIARSRLPRSSSQRISSGRTSSLRRRAAIGPALGAEAGKRFRFLHVSTDEVFGTPRRGFFSRVRLTILDLPIRQARPHRIILSVAWRETYGLPALITNCSNNYGPFHFPEKLIPLIFLNALENKPSPVYGDGRQVRDWLYVEDHVKALTLVARKWAGRETYNIGGARRWKISQSSSRFATSSIPFDPARCAAAKTDHACPRPSGTRQALCD